MENKGGLALESTDFSLEKGESKNIVVVAVPEGYSDDDLVYESNKPNVVSVNSSGLVKAISSGSASITIKT
ncbi:MAG: Ig-like domain-containing protein, partial [Lactobacillus sp.]|nr:Ig-like domain-containing protein [Lactobacillus sp.]